MRGRRPTCAALVLILAVVGGVTYADAAKAQSAPAGNAGLNAWNSAGNDVETGPHVGWSWRAEGDPTAPVPLNSAAGANAAAGFASPTGGIDGRLVEGRHHQYESRILAQERSSLQRECRPNRVLRPARYSRR